ncbi:MAG: Smr/MutS family protein [Prevotella sp.]|nr:Smr/MutS family protein [Bacteroides sp.]MCM1366871.1 Smr/MutS family protein [Prevotella sp.]
MTYPANFENKIGFTSIRELLNNFCISAMGRRCVENIRYSSDFNTVKTLLTQVSEMKSAIEQSLDIPLDGMFDLYQHLITIKSQNIFLQSEILHKLSSSLKLIQRIKSFFLVQENTSKFPYLTKRFSDIDTFPEIISKIDSIVNNFGEIKDDASLALYNIRIEIKNIQSSMSALVHRVISSAVSDGILDKETTPTLRDGRLVIPVPATHRKSIQGIVHDQSATGKTVFIEPTQVVQTSNKLRLLQLEEEREIIKILTETTDFIRPLIDNIIKATNQIGVFDCIHAKALLAIQFDAQMPVIEKTPEIDWYHAVHPILKLSLKEHGRDVVPLNINLSTQNRILIISGPNAGGKSVCLKTVGIIQYMVQCGILPTIYSNSHVAIFKNIFIDIGDEQSIENDLSTYSSHLRNMKHFLRHADNKTLILADEMGSGTEPQIGGALAQAIIHALNQKKCFGIITTHYQNLKTFADSEAGLVNGAMLYDRQHLQPLFQLAIGSPGSSFALEIAKKTGLDPNIINEAKNIVGSQYINSDKYILDIARDRRYWENKRAAIKEKERKIDSLIADFESKADLLKTQRNEIIRDAKREAKEILATANAKLENTIHEIRKSQAEKEKTKAVRAELDLYKRNIENELNTEIDDIKTPKILKSARKKKNILTNKLPNEKSQMSIGDYVRMSDGGVTGKILSISGDKAEVAFGALRTIVNTNKLKQASKPKQSSNQSLTSISTETSDNIRNRQLHFNHEIDVRGMRADEAIQAVTYFIDDAIQFSANKVRILHGTGHGILRQLIRQYLATNPNIESATDEDIRFGGAGITVVTLS